MNAKARHGCFLVVVVLCTALLISDGCAAILGIGWSPSGQHIAVLSGRQQSKVEKIVVLAVTSLPQARVTCRLDASDVWAASWLPPKEEFCYVNRYLGSRTLVVRGPDGRFIRSVSLPGENADCGISVSSTGDTLALGEYQGGNSSSVGFLTRQLKYIVKWRVEGTILDLQWLPDTSDAVAVQTATVQEEPVKRLTTSVRVVRVKSGPAGKAIPLRSVSWCYSLGGTIYFTRRSVKYVDVFKLDTSSNRQTRILDGSKWRLDSLVNAGWSPQARILVIAGRSGLVLVNLATGTAKIVWPKAGASRPALSTDGKRLAFVSGKKVVIMDLTSGRTTGVDVL